MTCIISVPFMRRKGEVQNVLGRTRTNAPPLKTLYNYICTHIDGGESLPSFLGKITYIIYLRNDHLL